MKIETLSLIASTRCNLRCTYCFLCKTESSSITDDKIREAVTDGSYLYNCNRVITTLGATCGDITKLDFWGGEPTLNLSLWIEKIPDWAKYYKNIETIGFVTNGTFSPEEMIKFIKVCDDKFYNLKEFEIQVSLDGPGEITSKYRGIDPDTIISNVERFLKLLHNVLLTHTKVIIPFKPTVTIDNYNLIHSSIASATNYYRWWSDIFKRLENVCTSSNFLGCSLCHLTYALMDDYTQDQGLGFAHSYNVYENLNWDSIIHDGLLNDIYKTANPRNMVIDFENGDYSTTYYCGAYTDSIMVRYDGSIIGCLAGLYNDDEQYKLDIKDNPQELLYNQMVPKHFYFKPLQEKPEYIDKFIHHKQSIRESINTPMSGGMAIAHELALSGQISKVYIENLDLLLRHLYLIQGKSMCYYNNLRNSGLIYVPTPGTYRLFLNGFLFIYDIYMGRN